MKLNVKSYYVNCIYKKACSTVKISNKVEFKAMDIY